MRTEANAVFKALADPTRRGLFERLSQAGEQTVHALTAHSAVSQPAVSKHLSALKQAGLVRHRCQGRETFYRAQPKALVPLVNWMSVYATFWDGSIARLEDLLKRMDP